MSIHNLITAPATDLRSSTPPPNAANQSQTKEEQDELAFGQVWTGAGHKASSSPHTNHKHSSAASPNARPSLQERRKSSVQFSTGAAEETIRRESTCAPIPRPSTSSANLHRTPSPPPPIPYSRGVAFDTFATPDAAAEAFSIQYKHHDFQYTPRTRTFICGTDAKDYSEYALEWTLDELVDDGDEIVCLRVVSEDSSERRDYKREADRLLNSVIAKNAIERKAISFKMELAVGKVTDVIQSMIQLYEPVAIIVGTRGRALTGMQGLMGGSVSKYCLQRSPVPTIVVRPSSKRTKKKVKRQQEAGRSVYTNILSKAQNVGGRHVMDRSSIDAGDFTTKEGTAEASAVEKAVGPPQARKSILRNRGQVYGGPLARVTSTAEDDDDDPNARFALPIGFLTTETAPSADVAMKSPFIQALVEDEDSPRHGSRTHSPAPHGHGSEGALTDNSDDDTVGMPTIVDERRPSTRSQNAWLNSILSRPEVKGGPRPESRDRIGSRSRSR